MKKGMALLLGLMLALCIWGNSGALADTVPTITPHPTLPSSQVDGTTFKDSALHCRSAILVDQTTGTVLYELDADSKQYPASITKIMTCLLALEYSEGTADGLQEKVTVAPFDPMRSDYTQIGMVEGEVYTLEQLLYGLMLASGNDAAVAIADHIAGSISNFADLMNARAQELGMTGTHFVNPNGIHDDDHYTTARDMMLLTREAMRNETFRTIVATRTYTCPATNKNPERKWINTNRYYGIRYPEYEWEPAIGVKTGYTNAALNTFVCAVSYEGRELIGVTMGFPDTDSRFNETKTLMRYGLRYFDNMDLRAVAQKQQLTLTIPNAESGGPVAVSIASGDPVYATLPVADTDALTLDPGKLTVQITPVENLSAPVTQGSVVGTAELSYNGTVYGTVDVTVNENVAVSPTALLTPDPAATQAPEGTSLSNPNNTLAPATPPSSTWSKLRQALLVVIGILLVLIAGAVIYLKLIPAITGRNRRSRARMQHSASVAARRTYYDQRGRRSSDPYARSPRRR